MSTVNALFPERVCLVDEDNRPVGDCLKAEVHGYHTPLHRAFSVFLFDDKDRLLLQQRAHGKLTWPGIWSNSCCGHPAPGEGTRQAALRRVREELNLHGGDLFEALPDFRYRSRYRGVEENEICPVYIGRARVVPSFDPYEIADLDWMEWEAFLQMSWDPAFRASLSPWSRWEARRLHQLGSRRAAILSQLKPFNPFSVS